MGKNHYKKRAYIIGWYVEEGFNLTPTNKIRTKEIQVKCSICGIDMNIILKRRKDDEFWKVPKNIGYWWFNYHDIFECVECNKRLNDEEHGE